MVVRCHFPKCNRNNKDDEDHAFFSLPKDPVIRNKWVQFAGWKNPRDIYRICEDHFHPKCIWKRHPRALLIKNSVPTISSRTKLGEKTNSICDTRGDLHDVYAGTSRQNEGCERIEVSVQSVSPSENEKFENIAMAGNEDLDNLDAPKKAFKCCKTKSTTILVCVNCGNVYHRSCIKRDLLKMINIKGDVRIECCKSKVVRPEEDINKVK